MAGLYIHIPFCASRCIYCGFYSTTLARLRPLYVEALLKELHLRRDYISAPWHTIYIGGGTPSQLSPELLQRLFSGIDCSAATEVTMECNPDDITLDYAEALAAMPVNRVSMGVQTFSDDRLRFLHRRHTAGEVETAVGRLRSVGIGNISIDLMFGFPGETMDDWRSDMERAIALDVEHISAYSLTYEEGTKLFRMREEYGVKEVDEEVSRDMYYALCDRLGSAGYEHYELSNFARPGFRSRHNSGYWKERPYMGIGAAAHSYDIRSRQWNVADVERYIEAIEHDTVPSEMETLDLDTRYNDTVMLSLRTAEGIDLAKLERDFGAMRLDYCLANAAPYVADGLLCRDGHRLRLTRNGLFVSDMVMADLMKV